MTASITRYPVLTYFALAFALSWGALLTVAGPGGFNGTTEPTNAQLPFVFLAMSATVFLLARGTRPVL